VDTETKDCLELTRDELVDHLGVCEETLVSAAVALILGGNTVSDPVVHNLVVLANTRVTSGPKVDEALRSLGFDMEGKPLPVVDDDPEAHNTVD